jgi:hypothetical protein
MKCPHCTVHFRDNWVDNPFARQNLLAARIDGRGHWGYRFAFCPKCQDVTIEIAPFRWGEQGSLIQFDDWRQVYSIGANRGPVPPEVPPNIADDYIEACNVLPISAKTSAALARRCLQNMLHPKKPRLMRSRRRPVSRRPNSFPTVERTYPRSF